MMTAPREPEREDPAEIRRRVPRASPGERIRLLELAGDSYLAGGADLEAALDCYRQALELARSPADVKPEPTDTWLLASLKLSRRLEEGR